MQMTDEQAIQRIGELTDEVLRISSQMESGLSVLMIGAFEDGKGSGFSKAASTSLKAYAVALASSKMVTEKTLEAFAEQNGPEALMALLLLMKEAENFKHETVDPGIVLGGMKS